MCTASHGAQKEGWGDPSPPPPPLQPPHNSGSLWGGGSPQTPTCGAMQPGGPRLPLLCGSPSAAGFMNSGLLRGGCVVTKGRGGVGWGGVYGAGAPRRLQHRCFPARLQPNKSSVRLQVLIYCPCSSAPPPPPPSPTPLFLSFWGGEGDCSPEGPHRDVGVRRETSPLPMGVTAASLPSTISAAFGVSIWELGGAGWIWGFSHPYIHPKVPHTLGVH